MNNVTDQVNDLVCSFGDGVNENLRKQQKAKKFVESKGYGMDDAEVKLAERKTRAKNLADHLSDYVETYLELGIVNATQKAAGVATVALTAALLSFFCLFVLFFAGLGVAVWLGESCDDMKAGYFTVAGFYVLCALLFITLRKKFILPFVRDHIIKKVYE